MSNSFVHRINLSSENFVSLYFGKGAGKQIKEQLEHAKSEVLIISPYISENKIDTLIKLRERGVDVYLSFSSLPKYDIERSSILRKLIQQNKFVDSERKSSIIKRKNIYNGLLGILVILMFLFISLNLFQLNGEKQFNALYLASTIFILCIAFYIRKLKKRIENTPVNSYTYTEKGIRFKYIDGNGDNFVFIHSKIYVIDRKDVYLGSMNFTDSGFSSNFETRVRITEAVLASEIADWVRDFFENNIEFPAKDINHLGAMVYNEPIY